MQPLSWPHNHRLLKWSGNDYWTLDHASLGTLITGATGSGKSTGPFQYVLRSFLRSGFGGLFLVAKIDAAAEYIQLARSEGRENDVILFRPDTPGQGFNLLDYEIQKQGSGKSIIENIVLLLLQAVEVTGRRHGSHGDPFFEDAMKALLRHCLFAVITARGKVDLSLVLEIVQSLPQNLNDIEEADH